MNPGTGSPLSRRAAVLAINLLYLEIWGFGAIGKLASGVPPWFGDKFGTTLLSRFPGLTASFWLLTAAELLAFVLALFSLLRLEFLRCRPPTFLKAALAWSLFVFVQLGFGQWLTGDYASAFQLFGYFGLTLVALQYTQIMTTASASPAKSNPE
jgi:hypothetical protein